MEKTKIKERTILYLALLLASVVLFGGMYGFSSLDPKNISYVYNNYDAEQHYFGWSQYSDAPWGFPLGLHDRLIYPDQTSVIFTDSIPLLAFIFKLFSPVLPDIFQYFGIWALISLFLTGVFSAEILLKFTKRLFLVFFSSVLMMLMPTIVIRAFAHEALGGQWLLMLSLFILFSIYEADKKGLGYGPALFCFYPALTGFLAAGIHIYFIPICGIIMFGCALYITISEKNTLRSLILLGSFISAALFSIYIWGGFSVDLEMSNDDYLIGNAANFNTLINPVNHSLFFKGLPLNYVGQDDGYGYLGLGIWMAVTAAVILSIKYLDLKENKALFISVLIMLIAAFWFATYPIISVNSRVLFTYRFPGFLNNIMAVFRCNGRGIWVVTYTVGICASLVLCLASEKEKIGSASFKYNRILPLFLILCIILQVADFSLLYREKYEYCNSPREYNNPLLKAPELNEALKSGRYEHVFMDDSLLWAEDATVFACLNHLTTGRFYLARQNEEANMRRNEEAKQSLSRDTLYFFPKERADEMKKLKLHIIYKGDYNYVGVVE